MEDKHLQRQSEDCGNPVATEGTEPAPTAQASPNQEQPPQKPTGKRSGGPPKGSMNAYRHGLRCGALGKGRVHIERNINQYRRDLEVDVLAVRGIISTADAGIIKRACKAETRSRLASLYVAERMDEFTPDQFARFDAIAARAELDRDRAVADLALNDRQMASLYATIPQVIE